MLTEEILNKENKSKNTVWYYAAKNKNLGSIPEYLFSANNLNKKSFKGNTIWHVAAANDT